MSHKCHGIKNLTLAIDAYLLEEQFWQISLQPNLKRRSFRLVWRWSVGRTNKMMSSDMRKSCSLRLRSYDKTWSWSYTFGLGLDLDLIVLVFILLGLSLNILVLFPSLIWGALLLLNMRRSSVKFLWPTQGTQTPVWVSIWEWNKTCERQDRPWRKTLHVLWAWLYQVVCYRHHECTGTARQTLVYQHRTQPPPTHLLPPAITCVSVRLTLVVHYKH